MFTHHRYYQADGTALTIIIRKILFPLLRRDYELNKNCVLLNIEKPEIYRRIYFFIFI